MRVDEIDNPGPEGHLPPEVPLLRLVMHTRLGLYLLSGVPALLAVATALAVAVASAMVDTAQLREHYTRESLRYYAARDYRTALVGFERLATWDENSVSPDRFRLALCLEAMGEHRRAAALIDRLAPDDGPGYAHAHVWKARRLMNGPRPTAADARAAESQLLNAVRADPQAVEPRASLATLYQATGHPDRAVPYLEELAETRPELLMPLARGLRSLGGRFEGRDRARAALEIYKNRAEADPHDFASRLRWAEAAVFLEDFPEAVTALRRATAAGTEAPSRKALAQVYAAWSDALGRDTGSDLAGRLALLEQGLALDPESPALIDRFAGLIRAGGAEGARALAAMRALVAGGHATGPVLFALGLDAWEHGRPAEACLHWQEACRVDPGSPVFANNLAFALASGPVPDLLRALATVNPVVALHPGDPRFRGTRGEILARLGRWRDALPDLKAALLVYPDRPELHLALAETYMHLDAPAMAAEHRNRADALGHAPNPAAPRGPARR